MQIISNATQHILSKVPKVVCILLKKPGGQQKIAYKGSKRLTNIINMSLRRADSPNVLQVMAELDMPDLPTILSMLPLTSAKLDNSLPRLYRLELDNELLLNRTKTIIAQTSPKSNSVFRSVEQNKVLLHSSRCCTFAYPVQGQLRPPS